jgi:NhaP-type Na+/H+ or K+/H+ antiporter
MYEHHTQPLLPRARFLRRLALHGLAAGGVVAGALGLGVLGYHLLEGLPWIDALLNASMILGGMGPVDTLHTAAGKLFASLYSLFSGIVFLVTAGILVAPVAHRFLHRLHLNGDKGDGERRQP